MLHWSRWMCNINSTVVLTIIIFSISFTIASYHHQRKSDLHKNRIPESVVDQFPYSLENMSIMNFLSSISGQIKIGNVTVNLPDDLPALLNANSKEFSRRTGVWNGEDLLEARWWKKKHKIKVKFPKFGWGWGGGKKDGLLSLNNLFRAACILMDLNDIKESSKNGLYK